MEKKFLSKIETQDLIIILYATQEGYFTEIIGDRLSEPIEFESSISAEHVIRNLMDCGINYTIGNALFDITNHKNTPVQTETLEEWYANHTIKEVRSWNVKWEQLDRHQKACLYFQKTAYIPSELD